MRAPAVVLIGMLAATAVFLAVKHFQSKAKHPLAEEFERFIAKWNKVYASAKERESRFMIFVDNYEFVKQENAKGHKYTLAVNEFADLTADEFGKTYMGLAKPQKMWGELPYLGRH